MLIAFQKLGCNMNIKVHFLFSHFNRSPDNLAHISDEQGPTYKIDGTAISGQIECKYGG